MLDRNKLALLASRPHRSGAVFHNYARLPAHGLTDFLRWQRDTKGRFPPGKRYPLHQPDPHALQHPDPATPQLTWIGHASFLFQYQGVNLLTDPVFSDRASPLPFVGPRRFTPPALTVSQLPDIDLVLISHNHYDHLDRATVIQLVRRFGHRLCFVVPAGLRRWFMREGIRNVIELDWWQYASPLTQHAVTACAVPAQHFSGRGARDRNRSLWCGWVMTFAEGYSLYFAGDTGYGEFFTDIGDVFDGIDLALIPIGAYAPRWLMSPVHVNPDEAVLIHEDIRARQSVAMHWGTFVLTDEAMDEPPRRLHQVLAQRGHDPACFRVMQHGERITL